MSTASNDWLRTVISPSLPFRIMFLLLIIQGWYILIPFTRDLISTSLTRDRAIGRFHSIPR